MNGDLINSGARLLFRTRVESRCSEDVQSHRNSSCISESTINILLQVNFFHLILVKNNI